MTKREMKLLQIKLAAFNGDKNLTRLIIESHINFADCMQAVNDGIANKQMEII